MKVCRGNPTVIHAVIPCFVAIIQALEAETIQGQTAQRAAASAKKLLQAAGMNLSQAFATSSPETQHAVRGYFQ